jgi:hypothetical protein
MRYFPVECASVTGTDFSCATFEQQGQWLNLMTYCASQENGGRIEGAAELPAVFFQRSLSITKDELLADCPLWTWQDEDLLVKFYPIEGQEKCQDLRKKGAKGGRNKAANAKEMDAENEPLANAIANATANASTDLTLPNPTLPNNTQPNPTPSGGAPLVGQLVSLDEFVEFGVSKNLTKRFCKDRYEQLENDGWLSGGKPVKSWQRWLVAVGKKQGAFNPSSPKDQPTAGYSMEYVEIEMRRKEKEMRRKEKERRT